MAVDDEGGYDDPLTTLQRMGRALHLKDGTIDSTLDSIVQIVVGTVPGADFASVSLVTSGSFRQSTVSDGGLRSLGDFEALHRLGPCTDSSNGQDVVRIDDMNVEARWDGFAAEALSAGVTSMLCLPLWVDEQQLGSLSVYARKPNAFGESDEQVASVFASYAALALADAYHAENLKAALANRDVIGQGKGILMERHRITADRAFQMLADASQRANRKLAGVAEELVRTGQLP